ncbi:MAG: hypothetical protein PWR04_1111 [Anaerophaga sp.]|nr:hypothetical protein [Anaerophaga sp.]
MDRLIFLIFFTVLSVLGISQNNISTYQYWFDDNFSGAISNTVVPEQNFNLNSDIDASGLNTGVHLFYIRFKDENALWSCPLAQFIYKIPEQNTGISTNEIAAYQYWFDDDYNNAVNQPVTPAQDFVLLGDIDAGSLSTGVHVFYIRYKDSRGQWSSPLAQFIYKIPEQNTGISANEITAYQYWFDDDYNNAVNQPVTPVQDFELLRDIDAGALSSGIHAFYIRYKDSRGQWSSPIAQFIYKISVSLSADNNIVAYRYWFDDDFENAVNLPVVPAQSILSLTEQIDMTQMMEGEYTLHCQFQDTMGMWSSPTIDTIVKNALPIAKFTYNRNENCDSTIIDFHNLSIDGDIYLWDFGDGSFSEDFDVSHIYHVAGNYNVSLAVSDTVTGLDSTYYETINIIGHTASTISVTACGDYLTPSGDVLYESGIYYDTIPNSMSCDSIIEINLEIINIDNSVEMVDNNTLVATQDGADYQWLNCDDNMAVISGENSQSFIPAGNGNYAVEITLDDCAEISACYEILSVGIIDNVNNYDINIFPNPAKEKLYIRFPQTVNRADIEITDLSGNIVDQIIEFNTDLVSINLTQKSGIYFLKITADNHTVVAKAIIYN